MRSLWILVAVFALACSPARPQPAEPLGVTAPAITTCFTPGGECEAEIVALIAGAKKSVHAVAYELTSQPVATALIAAHAAGRDVGVVLDAREAQAKASQLPALIAAGVPVWLDGVHAIQHQKIMCLDCAAAYGATVELGSYNYSAAAQSRNAETFVVIRSRALAQTYEQNWAAHRDHSVRQPIDGGP